MAEMKVGSKRSMRIVLRDLPNEALCYVASFLSAPSKALFAIALRRDENASNAIIHGEQWDTLDFGDVERIIAVYRRQIQGEKAEAHGMHQYYRFWIEPSSCFRRLRAN
jgi:hypothetical protein